MNGRPMCECIEHTGLNRLCFPEFPYTTKEYFAYETEIVKLGGVRLPAGHGAVIGWHLAPTANAQDV